MKKLFLSLMALSALVAFACNGLENEAKFYPKPIPPCYDGIVIMIYGQSNAAGFEPDATLPAAYTNIDSNILFWTGPTNGFLPMSKTHNEYPSENGKYAFEFSLAWKLRAATGKKIYVIKHAVGSTSMHANWKVGGTTLPGCKTTFTNGLAAVPGTYITCMIMNQGENDSNNSTRSNAYQGLYGPHLDSMLTWFNPNYYICCLTDYNLPAGTSGYNLAGKVRSSQINVINAKADTTIVYYDPQLLKVNYVGTSTGMTSTSLTDAAASWTTNQWFDYRTNYVSGGLPVKRIRILSNTSTVLSLGTWPTPTPPATSDYQIAWLDLHFNAPQIDSLGKRLCEKFMEISQ